MAGRACLPVGKRDSSKVRFTRAAPQNAALKGIAPLQYIRRLTHAAQTGVAPFIQLGGRAVRSTSKECRRTPPYRQNHSLRGKPLTTTPSPARREWLRTRGVTLYTTAVILGGVVIAVAVLLQYPPHWVGWLLFALTAAVAELTNVELFASSRSRVSVSSIIGIASILALGPAAGVFTHLVSGVMTVVTTTLRSAEQGERAGVLRRTAFNAAMWVISAAAAGGVFVLLGGVPGSTSLLVNLFPLITAAATDVLLNLGLLIGVIALQTGQSPLQIWRQNFQWAAPIAILGGIVGGGALAFAYDFFGALGVAIFLIPILATAYSYRVYVENSKGYIDQIEKTLANLKLSEERYALATRGANDGLWDWDLKSNEVFFSPRWKAVLGYAPEELPNVVGTWWERVHPEDIDSLKHKFDAHLAGVTEHFEHEHRVQHKDSGYRWVLTRGLAVRDDNGVHRMAGSLADITERKNAEAQLLFDAFHDQLTGLPNRALFIDRLSHAVDRAKRGLDFLYAVLFLDFDRFKVINDSLGHKTGDDLLIAFARRIEKHLAPGDTIARLGGDEFVILLNDLPTYDDATPFAEQIQEWLKEPFPLAEREVFITASVGVVLSTTRYDKAEEALQDADIAMYQAKAQGKMRFAVFDTTMRKRTLVQMAIETDLRHAIDAGELKLYYQPIVSLTTGTIASFEALLRWKHPVQGMIHPAEFLQVAEETGLILQIDRWVLQEACRQMRTWQKQFPAHPSLTVSVNLSSLHIAHPQILDQIQAALEAAELAPSSLQLEITEGSIIENADAAKEMLAAVRGLGVRLSIDDFGTGYSSLQYLHSFPFNVLKIDRSFVKRIGMGGENIEIVRTIAMLAHDLGMEVTAEGIESWKQLAQVRDVGCEFGQGFLLSQPVPATAVETLITQGIAVTPEPQRRTTFTRRLM